MHFTYDDPILFEEFSAQFLSEITTGVLIDISTAAAWTLALDLESVLCLLLRVTLLAHGCLALRTVPYHLQVKIVETNDALDGIASINLDVVYV